MFNSSLFAQPFGWAKGMGSIDEDHGSAIRADNNGDIIIVGAFRDSVDFDPSDDEDIRSGTLANMFVEKFDSLGNLGWVKTFESTGEEVAIDCVVDAENHIFITGVFSDTVDFDPGLGITNLIAGHGQQAFILKLDMDGNFIWVKRIGDGRTFGRSVALDTDGNVVIVGEFHLEAVDFNPDGDAEILVPSGIMDIFILKLDPEGNFVWVKGIQTSGDIDRPESIITDNDQNIYVAGNFRGTGDFDPNDGTFEATSYGLSDGFLLKLNSSGDFIWLAHQGSELSDYTRAVTIDDEGNVILTGHFANSVDFDPGEGIEYRTSFGEADIFVQKLSSDGILIWVKTFGGGDSDWGMNCYADESGGVYISGSYSAIVDFDPNEDSYNVTSNGLKDIFIQKLDREGNFEWVKSMGGEMNDFCLGLTVFNKDEIYITGAFESSVADFDPEIGEFELNSAGGLDIFICKLGDYDYMNIFDLQSEEISIYPNPSSGVIRIAIPSECERIEVLDNLGNVVYQIHDINISMEIDLSNYSSGLYIIELTMASGEKLNKKVIINR